MLKCLNLHLFCILKIYTLSAFAHSIHLTPALQPTTYAPLLSCLIQQEQSQEFYPNIFLLFLLYFPDEEDCHAASATPVPSIELILAAKCLGNGIASGKEVHSDAPLPFKIQLHYIVLFCGMHSCSYLQYTEY